MKGNKSEALIACSSALVMVLMGWFLLTQVESRQYPDDNWDGLLRMSGCIVMRNSNGTQRRIMSIECGFSTSKL